MENLLKETPNSQLFTVFGSPRTKLTPWLHKKVWLVVVKDLRSPMDSGLKGVATQPISRIQEATASEVQ
jgi:hypothetical protein